MKRIFTITCFIALASASYSQQKEHGFIKRLYHNTTARYNGYFHAKLRINQAMKQVKSSIQLNYTELLPLFPYYDSDQTSSVSPDMDEVIKKTSKVIKLHKISKWTDDCYFLLGRAYFIKKDYENALKTFVFITTKYPHQPPKPDRYLSKGEQMKKDINQYMLEKHLKHRPIYFDAALWLIHTHIEMKNYEKAQTVIDLMHSNEHFPERLEGPLEVLQTHLYLRTNQNKKAAESLEKAIPKIKKRKKKARYTFTLAQINQSINQNQDAIRYYRKVLTMRPPYEMEFYAKINMAKVFEEGGNMSLTAIKNQLKDLAKDDKNTEYLDQIYYLLAQLSLKEKDTAQAVKYLSKSVRNSVKNDRQKALSYLLLAELHFEQEKYEPAKYYYDSTMTTLPESYPNYQSIQNRKKTLDELIKNILTVERQDSLLHLASLPEKERDKIIDDMIAQKRRKLEQAQAQAQANQQYNSFGNNQNQPQGYDVSQGGKWYFYNSNVLRQGQQAFTAKWGNRKLEDDWRRSTKSSNLKSQQGSGTEEGEVKIDRDKYLDPIPLTEKEQASANQKVLDALFQMGIIYREELQNYKKAIQTFEELNKRYKDHKYQVSSYYYLYSLYKKIGNNEKAEYFKNLILNEHPNSEIAQAIKHPNKPKQEDNKDSEVDAFYEKTYNTYQNGHYTHVIQTCSKSDSLFPSNPLQPKFDFLKALSYGQQRKFAEFKSALERIVDKYPKSDVKDKAQRILDQLNNKDLAALINENKTEESSIYAYSPRDKHFFVAVLSPEVDNTSKLNIIISNFNKKYFSLEKLQVSNLMLNTDRNMILVKSFDNASKGVKYLQRINKHKPLTNQMEPADYNFFIMSKVNFRTFYKDKNVEKYRTFFKENYVNDK